MATSATNPGIPKRPETADVAKLIGTWIPYRFPATLRKNKNNAPINTFITVWPAKRTGLIGAPENNKISISTPKIEITIIGSKKATPPRLFY